MTFREDALVAYEKAVEETSSREINRELLKRAMTLLMRVLQQEIPPIFLSANKIDQHAIFKYGTYKFAVQGTKCYMIISGVAIEISTLADVGRLIVENDL